MTPTLSAHVNTNSTTSAVTALSSGAITVNNGDVIVVKTTCDSNSTVIGTPTASGQTFTSRASKTDSTHCPTAIFTAVVTGSPGTITVSQVYSGSGSWRSAVYERWTNAQLATTPATNGTMEVTSNPGFTGTLTTVAANSSVSWVAGDFTPANPGTEAYQSGAIEDGFHNKFSANTYVAYYATQDAVSAGSQTFGLTTPASGGSVWTYIGIEIEQAAGAAAPLFTDLMPPQINH